MKSHSFTLRPLQRVFVGPSKTPPTPSLQLTFLYPRLSSTTSQLSASASASASRVIHPIIPPPDSRSGPLLSRRANRALPPPPSSMRTWLTTFPIFAALMAVSALAFFNYQKAESSTVAAILYALRTSPAARAALGDRVYFASKVPWIRGSLSPMQGRIDVTFWVKGDKGTPAKTRFVSVRRTPKGYFETLEWSLELEDGTVLQLLDTIEDGDPFRDVGQE